MPYGQKELFAMLQRPYRYKWRFFHEIGYVPREGQRLLHWAADYYRYIGFFAYPRCGKSYGAAMEVAATVHEPDYHCWIVAPTYALGAKEFGYIYQAHLQAGLLDRAKSVSNDPDGGSMRIEYPWGWWVEVKSADRPNLILAEEVDELILAEAPRLPEGLWYQNLFNRVEKRRGRTYPAATPRGNNWVHKEFWTAAQKMLHGKPNPDYDQDHWAIRVSHLKEERGRDGVCYQGGVYTDETIEKARKRMPPRVFREQFGGDFVSYSGTVYDSTKVKRVRPFEIPADWHVVIGYDHGASGRRGGNTAISFIAYDNEQPRNAYLYTLIYDFGHGAKWYVGEIRKRLIDPKTGLPRAYDIINVDRSAKQVRIELSIEGLANTMPPVADFSARFIRMSSFLEAGRFYVFDTPELAPFWYEIDRYEWKEGVKAAEPRGDAVQGPDDAMDSVGYALLHNVPGPSDEEQESALHLREETLEGKRATPLTLNERKVWKAVHEAREEVEDQEVIVDSFSFDDGGFDE